LKFKSFPKNEKGFSFSFDAMLAAFILIGTFIFVSTTASTQANFSGQTIIQKQLCDDILANSINLGKIQTLNSNQINGFIQANIPLNYEYQLEVTNYVFNSTKFDENQLLLFGNQTTDLNSVIYVESKKIFLNFYEQDINSYNTAKLRMWVK
jgi:hypothetical protein